MAQAWEIFYRAGNHSPQELGAFLIDAIGQSLRGVYPREKIEALVNLGADLDVRDAFGRTPLYMAVCAKDTAVLDIMIAATIKGGFSFDAENQSGQTAMQQFLTHYQWGEAHTDRAIRMFEHGASPHKTDARGTTLLMLAAQTGSLRLVEYLVSRGVDAAVEDIQGKTAAMRARDIYNHKIAAFLDGHLRQKALFRQKADQGLPMRQPLKIRKIGRKPPKL